VTSPAERDYSSSLEFGGLTRTYHVHLPASYDGRKQFSLVLAFHPGLLNGKTMEKLTRFSQTADKNGFIVVYPDGYKKVWAGPGLYNPAQLEGVDDVSFVSALIDKLLGELKIDRSRIYAAGMCNGGVLVQTLACRLSDRIAAIAGVATAMTEEMVSWCQPERPVPAIFMHGTEDTWIRCEGGRGPTGREKLSSVSAMVKWWVQTNGCSAQPAVTYEPDRTDDGMKVRREAYARCKDGSEVILYMVEGGGHTWPGGWQFMSEAAIGKTTQDIDASQIIWEFFQKHPMKR